MVFLWSFRFLRLRDPWVSVMATTSLMLKTATLVLTCLTMPPTASS